MGIVQVYLKRRVSKKEPRGPGGMIKQLLLRARVSACVCVCVSVSVSVRACAYECA